MENSMMRTFGIVIAERMKRRGLSVSTSVDTEAAKVENLVEIQVLSERLRPITAERCLHDTVRSIGEEPESNAGDAKILSWQEGYIAFLTAAVVERELIDREEPAAAESSGPGAVWSEDPSEATLDEAKETLNKAEEVLEESKSAGLRAFVTAIVVLIAVLFLPIALALFVVAAFAFGVIALSGAIVRGLWRSLRPIQPAVRQVSLVFLAPAVIVGSWFASLYSWMEKKVLFSRPFVNYLARVAFLTVVAVPVTAMMVAAIPAGVVNLVYEALLNTAKATWSGLRSIWNWTTSRVQPAVSGAAA
jgi:hypothetical protein